MPSPVGHRGIIRVGDGRGFVVQSSDLFNNRLVITAAHCLPSFPPPIAIAHWHERTYAKLLGPLGRRKPTVWAELRFADPIADIAVLGTPETQELSDEAEAYDALTEDALEAPIATPRPEEPAWLLSLDRQWFKCVVKHIGGPLWISRRDRSIDGGMSGSPIVADDGALIGVVTTIEGPHPHLAMNLPGWLLAALGARRS
jgi:hypothetical protein